MNSQFDIDGRPISAGKTPYMIAEISGNHGGNIESAFSLIAAAKKAGADAVKFQTYEAGTITLNSTAPAFQVQEKLWQGQALYDLYKQAETPFDWHEALFSKAREIGITAFSAPFDHSAVDLLESMNTPAYKIASCELVDIPLLAKVASTGKPMILSTGMASETEIDEALETCRNHGAKHIALLHCVSGYPTPYGEANVSSITALREKYELPIGLSDHTLGIAVPVAATALGATIIEKHICLERESGPVDAAFSLEPEEFKQLVEQVHQAHAALGKATLGPVSSEADSLRFRRSLYFVEDMEIGAEITENNVRSIRPSGGLHTRYYHEIIGRKVATQLKAGTPVEWDYLKPE